MYPEPEWRSPADEYDTQYFRHYAAQAEPTYWPPVDSPPQPHPNWGPEPEWETGREPEWQPEPILPHRAPAPPRHLRRTGYRRSSRQPKPRRSLPRRLLRLAAGCLMMALLACIGGYCWADSRLGRGPDLSALPHRVPKGQGTNYLFVGSDSRAGLSEAEIRRLHTGGSADDGGRTDSMILLHVGAAGRVVVLSLPRDSWVLVPPRVPPDTGVHYPAAHNRLNAAFALGGSALLVQTVELNTGIHIDHYAQIGFGGFVRIVDAVGGVTICVDHRVKDTNTGEDLSKGCHLLNGREALSFVRERHAERNGDLGREQNQQAFLKALMHKALSSKVLSDPVKFAEIADAGLGALTVDSGTDLTDLAHLGEVSRHGMEQATRLDVPTDSHSIASPVGSVLRWRQPEADRVFAAIRADQPVPIRDDAASTGHGCCPRPGLRAQADPRVGEGTRHPAEGGPASRREDSFVSIEDGSEAQRPESTTHMGPESVSKPGLIGRTGNHRWPGGVESPSDGSGRRRSPIDHPTSRVVEAEPTDDQLGGGPARRGGDDHEEGEEAQDLERGQLKRVPEEVDRVEPVPQPACLR